MRYTPRNHVQYFQPSPAVASLPVVCRDAGASWTPPGNPYPPTPDRHPRPHRSVAGRGRRLGEYQVVYIAEGEGEFECSGTPRRNVGAGTALLVRPAEWHRYAPSKSVGWQEYWVGFSGAGVEPLWRVLGLGGTGPVAVPVPLRDELTELYERLLRFSVQPGEAEQIVLAGVVHEILGRIAGALRRGEAAVGGDRRFERAREFMLHHVHGRLEPGALEQATGCSRSTLHRIFTHRVGVSPYRYYLSLKVDATKWELVHTASSMKAIAREYAFSDQYHFSRIFRETTGVRPSVWRRRNHRADDVPAPEGEQTRKEQR